MGHEVLTVKERLDFIDAYCKSDAWAEWCEGSRPDRCKKCGLSGENLVANYNNGRYHCPECGYDTHFDDLKHMNQIRKSLYPGGDSVWNRRMRDEEWMKNHPRIKALIKQYLNRCGRMNNICDCDLCGDSLHWKEARCIKWYPNRAVDDEVTPEGKHIMLQTATVCTECLAKRTDECIELSKVKDVETY